MGVPTGQGDDMRARIWWVLRAYAAGKGYPPTMRDVARLARPGTTLSTGLVSYHLGVLTRQGWVTHERGGARTYQARGDAGQWGTIPEDVMMAVGRDTLGRP